VATVTSTADTIGGGFRTAVEPPGGPEDADRTELFTTQRPASATDDLPAALEAQDVSVDASPRTPGSTRGWCRWPPTSTWRRSPRRRRAWSGPTWPTWSTRRRCWPPPEAEALAAAGLTPGTAPAAVARGESPAGGRVPDLPPEDAAAPAGRLS
jgi:hypothetical protein